MPTSARPTPLGVHLRDTGADVAVLAARAERVEFCLLDPATAADGSPTWTERRVRLEDELHGVWYGHVPDVAAGQRYGFRVHGRWAPAQGQRHNPAKLLLDPYARAVAPHAGLVPELYGYTVDATLTGNREAVDGRDSMSYAPHGVVVDTRFDWQDDERPDVPWSRTVLYEAHVKGLTMSLPGVPDELRGTYAGLGHPATVEYLTGLGVTTVELLPVHALTPEPPLAVRGVPNYWGYSTLGFFAPHALYSTAWRDGRDAAGTVNEFKQMVRSLHAAGLEVVLDVVYNHTCEGDADGPLLSWRGLDSATYYRLDGAGRDVDSTGCGNSLDFGQARVVQLTLDSLRYWHQEMRVDGFRFDLATTLARGRDTAYDPDHPFLVAARADPALATAKLIAEPWDLGSHGWRTGQFPPPFTEWNDRFRDSVRDFWLSGTARASAGEPSTGVRELATRLAGSADVFTAQRGPLASVNFVTAHDGFTLADLTAYNVKHNEANGEDNRDGSDHSRSWNHGFEGMPDPDDPMAADLLAARRRTHRAIIATLLLSAGVPMLVAGDEFGRTQGGNNNAYCQDGPISWLDWEHEPWQKDLTEAVRSLLALRRGHPVLQQNRFFGGRPVHSDGTKDLAWFTPDGREMDHDRWHDPWLRTLQMYLHAVRLDPQTRRHTDQSLLIVVQGAADDQEISLPGPPWAGAYVPLWDSASDGDGTVDHLEIEAGTTVTVEAVSVRVYGVVSPRG